MNLPKTNQQMTIGSLAGNLSASESSFNSNRSRNHAEASARFSFAALRTHPRRGVIAVTLLFARHDGKGRDSRVTRKALSVLAGRGGGRGGREERDEKFSASQARQLIIYSRARERRGTLLCRDLPSSMKSVKDSYFSLSLFPVSPFFIFAQPRHKSHKRARTYYSRLSVRLPSSYAPLIFLPSNYHDATQS